MFRNLQTDCANVISCASSMPIIGGCVGGSDCFDLHPAKTATSIKIITVMPVRHMPELYSTELTEARQLHFLFFIAWVK